MNDVELIEVLREENKKLKEELAAYKVKERQWVETFSQMSKMLIADDAADFLASQSCPEDFEG